MKKLISLTLLVTLLLSLTISVHADVIWEPFEDTFYATHREDFSYYGEYAYANSPEGVTQTYKKPGGSKGDTIENGELVYIQHTYTNPDGDTWALLNEYVYVPMAHLLNRYDNEFFTDHEAELTDTPPEITVEIPDGAEILTWTYPRGRATQSQNYWGDDILQGCTPFYTDPDGLVWGYIGYWYGRQNLWVCLSDCNNPDLAEPEIFLGETYWGENAPTGDNLPDATIQPGSDYTWLHIALPLVAVAIAGGLLLFWPRKKRVKQEEA